MNPNFQQPLQDEQAGIEEEAQDIDYDALYGGVDIDIENPDEEVKPKKEFTKAQQIKDYAKQFAKETLIGVGGTWGDLAELAGVAPKQTKIDEAKNTRDFETLDRINAPGNKPTWEDIISLESDDAPPSFTLPTSEMLRDANDFIGGPGEAETTAGKHGARSGKLYGAGLAFGQVNPVPAVLAGSAGQIVEDEGYGPLAQTAAEIATLLLTQGKGSSKTLVGSAKKEVQDKINSLRKLGYTEEDITLAINSASKGKKGPVKASKGTKTEKAFENFAEHSDAMVSDILSSQIPGIDQGIGRVHQMASDAYGQVAQQASKLTIKDPSPFINSATGVVRELRRNLGRNPEAEAFITRLADAVFDSVNSPSAENFMNFYKELNKAGNWMERSQKDRLLTQVKNGIKDTFRAEGKAGRQLAADFEEANAGIRKAYQAEDLMDIVQKTATQDGIDYKKLNKVFDKPDNVHLFEEVLGASQTRNLELIAKTGKEIKDFDKAWKATTSFTGNNIADMVRGGGAAYYLYKGDMKGLAAVLATKGASQAARKIAEKSLTDPRLQNIMVRGLHALKNESPKSLKSANEALKKYFDEEGIDVD